jgi:hypothetical protein
MAREIAKVALSPGGGIVGVSTGHSSLCAEVRLLVAGLASRRSRFASCPISCAGPAPESARITARLGRPTKSI